MPVINSIADLRALAKKRIPLDGAPSSISVLTDIVAVVSGRCEAWFDGGISCGQDILRAVALGAKACLIGKSFLYALAAMGGPGVTLALDILRKELEVTLALIGCTNITQVDPSILQNAWARGRYEPNHRGSEVVSSARTSALAPIDVS